MSRYQNNRLIKADSGFGVKPQYRVKDPIFSHTSCHVLMLFIPNLWIDHIHPKMSIKFSTRAVCSRVSSRISVQNIYVWIKWIRLISEISLTWNIPTEFPNIIGKFVLVTQNVKCKMKIMLADVPSTVSHN